MAFPNHIEVFHRLLLTSPHAIGDDMGAFPVISLRFSRGITCLVVGVELSLSLGVLPLCCGASLASWRTNFHN